ncbi:MAG: hypothetical protein IJP31_09985 [Lachnospiraceae bacterium]|nr:hypothetical protein [Lachnospiraceae bacterium]
MGRKENRKIFQDTQKLCQNISYLAEGSKHSRKEQKLILEGNPIHSDDCIYTPKIIVMKTDTAAPNLCLIPANAMNMGDGNIPARVTDRELLALHEKRWRRILDIALAGGNEAVILGAFGCGAFQNNRIFERVMRSYC